MLSYQKSYKRKDYCLISLLPARHQGQKSFTIKWVQDYSLRLD